MTSDPYAMYYVVRKDRPLTLGQAMAIAGAGAVRCGDRYGSSERWAPSFAAWRARPRKIALRAGADELAEIREAFDATVESTPAGETLLCLPPRRKSERGELLESLAPFTDARRPQNPPPSCASALVYVIRRVVIKTMGKAMAQAGHAAMLCVAELGSRYENEFARWRAKGMPGEVRCADDDEAWERLKGELDCVAVADAGLTQVAPGTETVLAVPPFERQPAPLANLERID